MGVMTTMLQTEVLLPVIRHGFTYHHAEASKGPVPEASTKYKLDMQTETA